MIIVDRESFIAWTQGILIHRTKNKLIVGDNTKHEVAEKLLEQGETIGFTVNGELFSTMKLEDSGYVERPWGDHN